MSDGPFIDWFVRAAETIAPNKNVYLINISKEKSKYVKSKNVVFAPIGSTVFLNITAQLKDGDAVFLHWVSSKAQKCVNQWTKKNALKTGVFFLGRRFF